MKRYALLGAFMIFQSGGGHSEYKCYRIKSNLHKHH